MSRHRRSRLLEWRALRGAVLLLGLTLVAGAALLMRPSLVGDPLPTASAPAATSWFERWRMAVPAEQGVRVRGRAVVVDGDSLVVGSERIRLYGVDAFERHQQCPAGAGRLIDCGQRAAQELARHVQDADIDCEVRDRDRYGRLVAICWAGAIELNALLVRQGWAVAYHAYSSRYAAAEMLARETGSGVWAYVREAPSPAAHRAQARR
jgi:endonuclease YncB( thermonuclease family)